MAKTPFNEKEGSPCFTGDRSNLEHTIPENNRTEQQLPLNRSEIPGEDARETVSLSEELEWLHDVEIGKGGDKVLKMEILRPKKPPEEPMPALVYIHGGGWNKGSKDDHVQKIASFVDRGYIGVSIQYRLTHEAVYPAQIEDCKLAIRYLRAHAEENHMDPERIGVWGTSAGGHLAALLGTAGDVKELEGTGGWQEYSSWVQAVCDWFGPTDFLEESASDHDSVIKLLGGKALENREKALSAMPGTYVSKETPPFLVMHGDKDGIVPYTDSIFLFEILKSAGVDVTLEIIKGAAHGFQDFPEATERVWSFFGKHLKKGL